MAGFRANAKETPESSCSARPGALPGHDEDLKPGAYFGYRFQFLQHDINMMGG